MANILLLDDSDVAGRAMQGILARGQHTAYVVQTPDDAWRTLREGVLFDLVFLELGLPVPGAGLGFLQRLREDWFWKIFPVVVYTRESDSRSVRRALALKVQNYLIKPYREDSVLGEVARALQNPWRNLHFDEPKSFCALMELTPAALIAMREKVMTGFMLAAETFPGWAEQRDNEVVFTEIKKLVTSAEAAGVWAGVDYLRDLQLQAIRGNWDAFREAAGMLRYASELIHCQLRPGYVPTGLRMPTQPGVSEAEAEEHARWYAADVDASGPVVEPAALLQAAGGLPGCPVIDTAAANFQMVADGRAANLAQVIDLAANDPGLCAQVLAVANRGKHDEMTAIEDVATAVNLLGESRLQALAQTLSTAASRHLEGPTLGWPGFWSFQAAVGRLAQFICGYLGFEYMKGSAYTAGLLHELGSLVLLKLHPPALGAIVRHAREHRVPVAAAERKYLGCTLRELGAHFADTSGLPRKYAGVIRWVEAPLDATEHADLVAIVALAREVCLHAHVGQPLDASGASRAAIESNVAWQVLRPRLFPSFDLRRFEVQAHAQALAIRSELSGAQHAGRLTRVQRAAELV